MKVKIVAEIDFKMCQLVIKCVKTMMKTKLEISRDITGCVSAFKVITEHNKTRMSFI